MLSYAQLNDFLAEAPPDRTCHLRHRVCRLRVSIDWRASRPGASATGRTADPKAISEAKGSSAEQIRGTKREFEIKSERFLSYQDGSMKCFNVEITVRRDERVFIVTAKEASVGANEVELALTRGVKVKVSDGFELVTDHATFNQNESIARAPGEITFSKGLMSGSDPTLPTIRRATS